MPVNNQLLNDCFIHDKDRLKHDEALSILKDRITPICEIEPLDLEYASGRGVS